jgi:hypothetical protein
VTPRTEPNVSPAKPAVSPPLVQATRAPGASVLTARQRPSSVGRSQWLGCRELDPRLTFSGATNNVGALSGALNSPPVNVQHDATHQSPLARISTRFVQLHKDYYGRGPEEAILEALDQVAPADESKSGWQGWYRESALQRGGGVGDPLGFGLVGVRLAVGAQGLYRRDSVPRGAPTR